MLIEESAIEIALPELVGPLTAGGRRAVNASFRLSYPGASVALAEDGAVQSQSLGNLDRLAQVPTLRPLLADVDEDDVDSHPAMAFAVAEVLSGVRLELPLFAGPWPAVWFPVPRRT